MKAELLAFPAYHCGVSLVPHCAVRFTVPLLPVFTQTKSPLTLLDKGAVGFGLTVTLTPVEAELVQVPTAQVTV